MVYLNKREIIASIIMRINHLCASTNQRMYVSMGYHLYSNCCDLGNEALCGGNVSLLNKLGRQVIEETESKPESTLPS